jgi:hypothetical protein
MYNLCVYHSLRHSSNAYHRVLSPAFYFPLVGLHDALSWAILLTLSVLFTAAVGYIILIASRNAALSYFAVFLAAW